MRFNLLLVKTVIRILPRGKFLLAHALEKVPLSRRVVFLFQLPFWKMSEFVWVLVLYE